MYSETYSEAVVTIHSKDKQQLFFVMIKFFVVKISTIDI